MKAREIYQKINEFAPFKTAESYDNVGLLAGDPNVEVKKALIALDCTDEVIEEAITTGAQLIITHHPIIFNPLKTVLYGSVVYKIIRAGLTVICAHTNLDMAKGGVNDALAKVLELCNVDDFDITQRKNYNKIVVFVPQGHQKAVCDAMYNKGAGSIGNYCNCSFTSEGIGHFQPTEGANPFIGEIGVVEDPKEVKVEVVCPKDKTYAVVKAMIEAHPYETPAFDVFENQGITDVLSIGRVGELAHPMTAQQLAQFAKEKLGCKRVGFVNTQDKLIKKVAICSGSGGSLLDLALQKGVDAYITADLKHNLWIDAKRMNIALMDCGHYHTERVILPVLKEILSSRCSSVIFEVTKVEEGIIDYV